MEMCWSTYKQFRTKIKKMKTSNSIFLLYI
uniref:Uncharacterized protein n=1 Tax=Lepeophtheirus salmonis TaxID=72036 RepID=A0A0K2UIK0_LEPSM